jgi:two-component system, cell cycle response regulator
MYKVLVIDDSEEIRYILRHNLESADFHVIEAENGNKALEILQQETPEVILLDWVMPGISGPEVAHQLRKNPKNESIYLIMLTSKSNSSDQIEGLQAGVDLYLTKPVNFDVLTFQIEKGVDESHRRQKANEDRMFAEIDALTNLGNRRLFDKTIEQEIARAKRHEHNLTFILTDIDFFKSVNDTHGHKVGDDVLKGFAYLLKNLSRETDHVFRYGGEEFAILLIETDLKGGVEHAEKLRLNIFHHEFPVVGKKTSSFGVSTFCQIDSPTTLLERADKALYEAKNSGRNRVVSQEEL